MTPPKETEKATEPEAAKPEVKAEEKPKEGEKAKEPEGVPEKYEFKAPEGYELDEKLIGTASEMFKELGLSQAQADKLFSFYTTEALKNFDAPFEKYQEIRTGWRNDILADRTIADGKDLLPEAKASIGRAIDGLGPDLAAKFREAMDFTGAGDNPAFVRAILSWANLSTEGRPVKGAGPSAEGQKGKAEPISAAHALYPNLR